MLLHDVLRSSTSTGHVQQDHVSKYSRLRVRGVSTRAGQPALYVSHVCEDGGVCCVCYWALMTSASVA